VLRETSETPAPFFRFMPLGLFLEYDFDSALRFFSHRKNAEIKNSGGDELVILPPVYAQGLAVYPVQFSGGEPLASHLTVPEFLTPNNAQHLTRIHCGIITAFSPTLIADTKSNDAVLTEPTVIADASSPATIFSARHISVFKICEVEFSHSKSKNLYAWEWTIKKTKWIKL
jgi:hypothetical protein